MVALRNDMEALKAIITDSMSLITKMVSLQHSGANQNVHQVQQVSLAWSGIRNHWPSTGFLGPKAGILT